MNNAIILREETYEAMLAVLKDTVTFLEEEIPWVDRNDPPAEGTMERAATDLADRIAAVIKQASGEL